MTAHDDKVAHVRRAAQTRLHTCHWPGCQAQVAPAKWGCYQHWRQLPYALRQKIWDAYQTGQEETLTPSAEYLAAAAEAQEWIRCKEGKLP